MILETKSLYYITLAQDEVEPGGAKEETEKVVVEEDGKEMRR